MVRPVIIAGIDLDATDDWGQTPLTAAISFGLSDVARALLEAGVDPNISDKDRTTPLHFAAFSGNVDVVKALLIAGAIVNVKEKSGLTPLNIAINTGHTDVARALLEAGADPNLSDEESWAPLRTAALRGHVDLVKSLLEAGASVNLNKDLTLLLAVSQRHSEFVDPIVLHIAKLNAAFQYISEADLLSQISLFCSTFPPNNVSQKCQDYAQEIKRMKEANETFHDCLKERDIDKLFSIWEERGVPPCRLVDQAFLKTHFPSYYRMLIYKVDHVKKSIFLHNHKPLVNFLSAHYRVDFQTMTYADMKRFFKIHRLDFMQELGGSEALTLMNFVDFSDILMRSIPKLKVIGFGRAIKSTHCFCLGNNQIKQAQSSHSHGACRAIAK